MDSIYITCISILVFYFLITLGFAIHFKRAMNVSRYLDMASLSVIYFVAIIVCAIVLK
jgi:hypothetical protein